MVQRLIVFGIWCSVGSAAGVSPVLGQTVHGTMYETGSKEPVILARVALLDTAFQSVDQTWTDELGRFTLRARGAGSFYIGADRSGYYPKVDGILDLGKDGNITIEFHLRPRAIQLDTLKAEARRRLAGRYLSEVGFTERYETGMGWFMTPDEVEKSLESEVATLLDKAPGSRVLNLGATRTLVFPLSTMRKPSRIDNFGYREGDPPNYCTPRVLVDGIEIRAGIPGIGGALIDPAVSVRHILAVEVHRGPATLPLIYGGTSTLCTTILIWTIQGPMP